MLELRPVCEHCAKDLSPQSGQAMICSFECTFCKECVEGFLENVCPNCGGGFCERPVRPASNHKNENYLGKYPAIKAVKHRPVDGQAHIQFSEKLQTVPPDER